MSEELKFKRGKFQKRHLISGLKICTNCNEEKDLNESFESAVKYCKERNLIFKELKNKK